MNLTKAIIAVAGYGTRRLPITKSLEKCMLPVGNRPIVDYLVEDCIHAGVKEIIFVVGEQHAQIKQYYSGRNEQLEAYLLANGKHSALKTLQAVVPSRVQFRYVVQDSDQPYGTAVPAALCADYVSGGEQVLFLAGDDFIYNPSGASGITQLLQAVGSHTATCGMLTVEVPAEDVSKYGVVELRDGTFVRIVEKPQAHEAPSNLINISKYILDKKALEYAAHVVAHPPQDGERQITDALNMYVQEGKKVLVVPAEGEFLDGGSLHGWVAANSRVTRDIAA